LKENIKIATCQLSIVESERRGIAAERRINAAPDFDFEIHDLPGARQRTPTFGGGKYLSPLEDE